MQDLIERLRAFRTGGNFGRGYKHAICDEAAEAITTAQAEIETLRKFREAALEAKALQEECAALCLPHEDEIHQLGVWLFDRLRDFRAALSERQP